MLLAHTAVKQVPEQDRIRLVAHNQQQFEKGWGCRVPAVEVDFEPLDGEAYQVDQLVQKLTEILPIVGLMVLEKNSSTEEESRFNQLKHEILWYSGGASATDLVPAVGLVSVPAIQTKMLHSLANNYGVEWNRKAFMKLISAMGTGFATQYGIRLGVRQLVKLIPAYGQTVGAATAATVSFSSTYALGRVACYYFYHQNKGAYSGANRPLIPLQSGPPVPEQTGPGLPL